MCLPISQSREERSREESDSERWKETVCLHMELVSVSTIDLCVAPITVKDTYATSVEAL